MATAYVSGLAALVKAQNPSLTHTEIKAAIQNTVDAKAALSAMGPVATGGRINAHNALPPNAPTDLSAEAISASQIDLNWADDSTNETGNRFLKKAPKQAKTRLVNMSSRKRW